MKNKEIILAAGCFWGVQHILDEIKGVVRTRVGYTGGDTRNPNYRQVCTGETNHAEAVLVEYDPNIIKLDVLLDYFWRLHDPTQFHRQGPDIGSQYRSAIFYYDEDQKEIALASKDKFDASKVFQAKAVTQIQPAKEFFDAEEYHQKYFEKNPDNQVCHILRPRQCLIILWVL